MSEVPQPGTASAPFCVRRPTLYIYLISAFLLLIYAQMWISLVPFAGEFMDSVQAHILLFDSFVGSQHGEPAFYKWCHVHGHEWKIKCILTIMVTLSLYAPLVFVAFALQALLFAVYGKDRAALRLSMVCQVASSLLIVVGIVGFSLLNYSYVSWGHTTPWFYMCIGAAVQLAISSKLTHMSQRSSVWK